MPTGYRDLEIDIENMIEQGSITSGGQRTVAVSASLNGEDDDVNLLQHYGFTSHVTPGMDTLILNAAGNGDNPVAVGSRPSLDVGVPKLEMGEVSLYSQHQQTVTLKANGDIVVTPGPLGLIRLGGDSASAGVLTEDSLNDIAADSNSALGRMLAAYIAFEVAAFSAAAAVPFTVAAPPTAPSPLIGVTGSETVKST